MRESSTEGEVVAAFGPADVVRESEGSAVHDGRWEGTGGEVAGYVHAIECLSKLRGLIDGDAEVGGADGVGWWASVVGDAGEREANVVEKTRGEDVSLSDDGVLGVDDRLADSGYVVVVGQKGIVVVF